jgi:hypothetical protein
MRTLKEALILKLKDEQKVDWYLDQDYSIGRALAYNAALKDIKEFISEFELGNISAEYLDQLEKG